MQKLNARANYHLGKLNDGVMHITWLNFERLIESIFNFIAICEAIRTFSASV